MRTPMNVERNGGPWPGDQPERPEGRDIVVAGLTTRSAPLSGVCWTRRECKSRRRSCRQPGPQQSNSRYAGGYLDSLEYADICPTVRSRMRMRSYRAVTIAAL